jgi:hypothetical protein
MRQEIAARALMSTQIHEICCPIVLGHAGVMRAILAGAGLAAGIAAVSEVAEASCRFDAMDAVDLDSIVTWQFEQSVT